MNPAFSAPQIRALLPVFQNSASKVQHCLGSNISWTDSDSGQHQLAQIWKEDVVSSGQAVVNVMEWLSRTTLDNIGEGMRGYYTPSRR
jgi:hypothetical protein